MVQNMTIRLAQLADIEAIMMITAQASQRLKDAHIPQWQGGYPSANHFRSDITKNQLYVAETNHQVLGFASISLDEDPNYDRVYEGQWQIEHPSVVIHRLAVDEKWLGHGIAQSLYRHAEVIARHHHRRSLKVDTHLRNQPMNHLLVKMGYQKVGMISCNMMPSTHGVWHMKKY